MKPKIPVRIREREKLFKRLYREGLIHVRRVRRTGYLSIRLSLCWRMLSKDNGLSWKTMSHAKYDTQIAIYKNRSTHELCIRGSCCPHGELSPEETHLDKWVQWLRNGYRKLIDILKQQGKPLRPAPAP
ncbi:MAG: ParE family toxin-like protein [Symbiopectobacterium sp.]